MEDSARVDRRGKIAQVLWVNRHRVARGLTNAPHARDVAWDDPMLWNIAREIDETMKGTPTVDEVSPVVMSDDQRRLAALDLAIKSHPAADPPVVLNTASLFYEWLERPR